MALAMLGADSIRNFNEPNKRARMCDVFFEITKNYLLTFDWPFARKYVELQEVDTTSMTVPENMYVFKLPNDCKQPRDVAPRGTNDKWEVKGNHVYTTLSTGVYLHYTAKADDASKYTDSFANLLAMGLAVRLAPSITQDKELTRALKEDYRIAQLEAWETEANVGNYYREPDEDPNNDSFVNPDGTELEYYRNEAEDSQ